MKHLKEMKVSIRYENQYGYIGFDPTNQIISVHLDHAGKRDEVEEYLSKEQVIPISMNNAQDFVYNKILANTGIAEFEAVLSCLWTTTGVAVEWSRPVE